MFFIILYVCITEKLFFRVERLKGIVLRTVKYGENGHIVDMFTDAHGRMSFMMKTGSTGKCRYSVGGRAVASHFMPLSMLEFDCNLHGQRRLPQPRSVTTYYVYQSLYSNPIKSAIALFVSEFLVNALQDGAADDLLYPYLEDSLRWLDSCTSGYTNFHLVLMMRLTRFLGIYPNVDDIYRDKATGVQKYSYFDMLNSEYSYLQPAHPYFLRPEEARVLPYLLYMDFDNMHLYHLSRLQRRRCLDVINNYYRLHLPGFGELKSLDVLTELFD